MAKYFEIRGQVGAGYKRKYVFKYTELKWVDPVNGDGDGCDFDSLEEAQYFLIDALKDSDVSNVEIVEYEYQTELEE